MNKNSSMTYYFNKISDLIKTKVYVDSNPLEQPKIDINVNEVKKIPLVKEDKDDINISTQSNNRENFINTDNKNGIFNINNMNDLNSFSQKLNSPELKFNVNKLFKLISFF